MSDHRGEVKGPVYVVCQNHAGERIVVEFDSYWSAKTQIKSGHPFGQPQLGWIYPASHICFSLEEAERILKP